MRFLPYSQAASVPNVIVDGAATERTILTLSHWPKSGTPAALRGDTSAQIVFNYLDSPQVHVPAEAASNNHFDEDGLIGLFTMIAPSAAEPQRELLIDAAAAGDFGIFRNRDAARIAFALAACAEAPTSPLPRSIFELPYAAQTGELYVALLALLPALLEHLEEYRSLWESEDAKLTASEELVEKGVITIEEQPQLDLAVVRIPEDLAAECHPFALHNRTLCTRLLVIHGRRIEVQYRYESWVQMASRTPLPRVDLSGLAGELNHEESQGQWTFDGVHQITPRLHLEGSATTSIPPDDILRRVEHHLRTGAPAWNPYD